MAKLDERMQMIGSAILHQAQTEANDLIKKASEIRETEIAACEDEVTTNLFDKMQRQAAEIRQESVKSVARAQLASQREVFLRREELTGMVFESARKKLLAFVETPEYPEFMLKKAGELKAYGDGCTLLVRQNDLELAKQLQQALNAKSVETDPAIRIGGFKLHNRELRILADETLDAKLEEQKPWFRANCELKVM